MNIYVGNISFQANDDDLKQHFEQYGEVSSATIILDRMSGRSKGFGFVEMPNDAEAKNAIDGTNGQEFLGRAIRVNESQPKPREDRRRGGGGGGGGGGFRGGQRERNW